MKKILTDFIKNFGVLTDDEVKLIVDNTNIKSAKKGTILLREGQIADDCYLILRGCIREYHLKDGVEKSVGFYTEGDSVTAYSSTANQTPSRRYLVCAEETVMTVSNQSMEQDMISRIPRLESVIRQETERISGQTQDDFAAFVSSSPEERYLKLIETKPDLLNRLPQHQIASYLGVTPESLSRIRKRLSVK